MTAAELHAWLALLRAPGLGARRIRELVRRLGGAAAVLAEPPGALLALGLPERSVRALGAPDAERIERDLAWLEAPGHRLLTFADPDFPPQLAAAPDPPAALFVAGDPALLAHPQVAIVGSRAATPAGRREAREFARALAQSGFAITSGLAEGIDAEAHLGALEVGGLTVAVTGCGLDRPYPPGHEALQRRIAERGVVASEFAPGTPPRAAHFPMRNRIIAGLALGVLVVEAGLHSGSLITARLAAEAGREVFAIPGSIRNPLRRGCHRLLREGATLVESPAEVGASLAPLAAHHGLAASAVDPPPPEKELEDPEYERLLAALGDAPVSADELVARTGLTVEVVSSMLLMLELKGVVASAGGGLYQRVS